MIDNLIKFSIRNKIVTGLMVIALIVWGLYSLNQLPIDAVPDITNNQVQVITTVPTLGAQEVEMFITAPVEYALATIPDILELRSISRFGLSVITVVFKEDANIYVNRQLVSEKIKEAEAVIPAHFGRPELMPLTTGLGEIYQYVIYAKPGYDTLYDAMELRTIQDWIVRRQLLGTPGVADVSSFGGFLKEYEVAVEPSKLRSMSISVTEVFAALEKNNQNTGAAYIDKQPNLYFIRGLGMMENISDIQNTVVKISGAGLPILIKDVAEVRYGHAVRYGALTRNDEGEVVGAIVMMLKGENSAQVIKNIKKKITEIQKSLPEGVIIEAFLDRTKLVNRTISTVVTNLTEGAIIVVLVLVLLLGNLRAGLVVASVIPLAMLFAISMMNVLGLSGNLMSLGAIDFGIIVDGAVIIVESILHQIHSHQKSHGQTTISLGRMNHLVEDAAIKIRSSAAFGEIIILIVYLPILALVGVEGKMFKPMAITVSLAILGAFILSLTYVPMISALMLSRRPKLKENFSDKINDLNWKIYEPIIRKALKRKTLVVVSTLALFFGSLGIFSRMGGEFIPSLDEGDFAAEFRAMPGTSLSQMVKMVTQASRILQQKFPDEVFEVIGKIGSSEIPTDPMPIEACDLMIILHEKDKWKSASSKEELAEKMQKALAVIPGVEIGFQQPIQMRFNELMTGARQDVAIKIFGEDLEKLAHLGNQASLIINTIEGAEDVFVEKTKGLPQVQVKYDRQKMAQYGVDVDQVNTLLRTAFAGEKAGVVFEGEKRFDLTVRFQKEYRNDIEKVRELKVVLPDGHRIPIWQVADISFRSAPAQISRENAERRITIGFNVRNRDVESIVHEIEEKFAASFDLPVGYYVTYGGQFQNLVEAKKRLSFAVPAALSLIFVLLYFTFGSVKQALLIFTAVPLSAIGGIFALYIRDLPFSISAGVGFIALFGVAVLNGIVLVGYFNQLKKTGYADIHERIMEGVKVRLRPVIMTASVASLGFLPMAISQSAGAEVQRPLATVVIGGLISATLLTLVVLPVLYAVFEKSLPQRRSKAKLGPLAILLVASAFLMLPQFAEARQKKSVFGQGQHRHKIEEVISR